MQDRETIGMVYLWGGAANNWWAGESKVAFGPWAVFQSAARLRWFLAARQDVYQDRCP